MLAKGARLIIISGNPSLLGWVIKGASLNDFCTLSVIVTLRGEGVQAMTLRKLTFKNDGNST